MKRVLIYLAVIAAVLTGSLTAHAAPPQTMNFQGVLKSIAGVPFTGTKKLTFKIYDASSGGNLLWTEIQPTVSVSKGQFSATLGAGTPAVPLTPAFDKPYWLGVTVDPEITEMIPRQPLTSEPYAFRAQSADNVSSTATITASQITGTLATAQLANSAVTAAKLAGNGCVNGQVMQFNGTAWVCAVPTAAFSGTVTGNLAVSGKVDIGGSSTLETLGIAGDATGLELGSGVAGKEGNAGKIMYQRFGSKDALDIVGAGPVNNRKIHFYSEAGAKFDGSIIFPDGSVQTVAKTDCMGRYEDNGNGTISDCRTGLVWLKNANCIGGALDWNSAASWVANLSNSMCGLSDGSEVGDWRMPTKTEWMTMVSSARKQGFTISTLSH